MLKFKIKEVLLTLDKRYPQAWLMKICRFSNNKAFNIINGKQKSISLADITELCYQLHCSPNDLLYWDPNPQRPLPPTHPCITQLSPPDVTPEWQNLFKNMYPDEVLELKKIAEEKIKNRRKSE